MCRYFYIACIDFMLQDKSLLEFQHLFSPNEYKNNVKIIIKHFQ